MSRKMSRGEEGIIEYMRSNERGGVGKRGEKWG